MKKLSILALCFLSVSLSSCTIVDTQISGFVDPVYRNNFISRNMIIIGNGTKLDEEKALETAVKRALIDYNVQLIKGLDLFPPTREYSNLEKIKIAQNTHADSILIINIIDRKLSKRYVPKTYHESNIEHSVIKKSYYGDEITINTYHSPGYSTDGYTISEPKMDIKFVLKNPKNGDIIWTADGSSAGFSDSSFNDLIQDIATSVVDKLSQEGLIERNR